MVTWDKINASAFPELMTEFLTNHPSLESPAKEPPAKRHFYFTKRNFKHI